MERLIARHCGVAVIKDKSKLKEAMEKLATYEDVEEQGLILRLPCKIGDVVFEANRFWKMILPRTVALISLSSENHIYIKNGCGDSFEVGVDIFLTKEEAEQALARMEGGNE